VIHIYVFSDARDEDGDSQSSASLTCNDTTVSIGNIALDDDYVGDNPVVATVDFSAGTIEIEGPTDRNGGTASDDASFSANSDCSGSITARGTSESSAAAPFISHHSATLN
jgi:hypothetical protein